MTVRAQAILDKSRPLLQRKCDCGPKPSRNSTCSKCSNEDDRNVLRRKSHSDREAGEVPPIVYDVLRSPGQPLDANTRAFFEPRFGHDFSSVRVHTNQQASESAKSINADAYTVNLDIAFSAGTYAPFSKDGRKLLAHELTHVTQATRSNRAPMPRLHLGPISSNSETEAINASEQILNDDTPFALRSKFDNFGSKEHVRRSPSTKSSSTTNPPWEAPNNAKTKAYIDDALTVSGGNNERAWLALKEYRSQLCYDMSLTAAEHYMFARYLVADTYYPSAIVDAAVLAYSLMKLVFRAAPRTGSCPSTPADFSQVYWGLRGVSDGSADFWLPNKSTP